MSPGLVYVVEMDYLFCYQKDSWLGWCSASSYKKVASGEEIGTFFMK